MEQFLVNLQVILPVIGLDLLKPQPKAAVELEVPVDKRTKQEVRFEILHKTGIRAEAVEEDGEFIVLEKSQALKEANFASNTYSVLRQSLVDSGILAVGTGDFLEFTKPYAFSSPSAAAAVVLDRNSNGRSEWKVKGSRRTCADWKLSEPIISQDNQ